jgi:carboxymethylenebutenolidase
VFVVSEQVTINVDGSEMPVYVAKPKQSGPRPAVIILQEIFGVNREVKRIADLVASAGYVGLAINYYHRTHPDLNAPYTQEGMQQGFAAAGAVTKAGLLKDVAAAVAYLNEQDFVERGQVVTWGFCFGGSVAFLSATLPEIKAAIAFYGGQIGAPFPSGEAGVLQDVASLKAPVLAVFGENDDFIPPAQIKSICSAVAAAPVPVRVVTYEGVGHAFFRESSAQMDAPAVADAWKRTQEFLRQAFGS